MTRVRSGMPVFFDYSQPPPPQFKTFPIILPHGVMVDKIYACIQIPRTGRTGVLDDYAGNFFGTITLDLSKALPNTVFVVCGFQGDAFVAACQGKATDLDLLDQIQLMKI